MNKKIIIKIMLLLGIFLTDNYKVMANNDGAPPIFGPTNVCSNQSFTFYTNATIGDDQNFYIWSLYSTTDPNFYQIQAPSEGGPNLPYFVINPLTAGTYTLVFNICLGTAECTEYNTVTLHVGTGSLQSVGQLCGDFYSALDGINFTYPSFMAQTSYSAGTSTSCNNSPTYLYNNTPANYTYIHSGTSVGVHAGSFINLNPGFTVASGANFVATITTTCPTGGNLRMADGFGSTPSQHPVNTASIIYPNPSNGIFIVNPKPGDSVKALTVLNSLGSIIYSNAIVISRFQSIPVDISSATSGIYYLKIDYQSGKTDNQKIILQ